MLDWILGAFDGLVDVEMWFVGGFRVEEVVTRYPGLRTVLNPDWDTTGPAHSLGLVPSTGRTTWVAYADVVFRRSVVEALAAMSGDIVLAVDTSWRERYDGRGRTDLARAEKVRWDGRQVVAVGTEVAIDTAQAEFAGVLRLGPRAAALASSVLCDGSLPPTASIPELVEVLAGAGLEVTGVDVAGEWAELDAKQDLARFVLGTKAESLDRLRPLLQGAQIGHLVSFTAEQWAEERDGLVDRILSEFAGVTLIVRSSALSEDGWSASAAGLHETVLGVAAEASAVSAAVDTVLASYSTTDARNQVLVQAMLDAVAMSGVVMTRTHATGAPYYVINFDDRTHRTDSVTGGRDARTIFVHRDAAVSAALPSPIDAVVSAVKQLEALVGHDSLDIEFAAADDGTVHVLQVRPIAVTHVPTSVDDDAVAEALVAADAFLNVHSQPGLNVVGSRAIYSVMSDWNPAEIIGTHPRRLATSLYRTLVTDEVWARQRAEYGYRDVRPCALLVEIATQPYIDVRASFNSFVPVSLSDGLATRLVEHAIDHLSAHPHLHDKVEFEVAFTCTTLDWESRSSRLLAAGFTRTEVDELRAALAELTCSGIARLPADLDGLIAIDATIDAIESSALSPLDKAFHLLECVRSEGTLRFAHLARAAFVATALLRSAVASGAVSAQTVDGFLGSIETVLSRMRRDGGRVAEGEMPWQDFVERYGHLRPGTYDVTSLCYRSAPDEYLRALVVQDGRAPSEPPSLPDPDGRLAGALEAAGLPSEVAAFARFARDAISGREEGKFIFTRALSLALEHLVVFAEGLGISREEIAHVDLHDLAMCRDAFGDQASFLRTRIREHRERYVIGQAVYLPSLITGMDDLRWFEQEAAVANFVTAKTIEAPALGHGLGPHSPVDGSIVCIPNADPGYDWLLARPIAGLITMYGGANSHMAVRAAELGLPAAIGVGETRFSALSGASMIRLDCSTRTISVLH
ncbi:MAG: PEP-utilizing enzyme [Actinomycetes bacterium]